MSRSRSKVQSLAAIVSGIVLATGCANTPTPLKTGAWAPVITPDLRPIGRVQVVNAAGRFVVLNFAGGSMPELEQRLGVFRDGAKIGEVKITGPQREFNIVAEIVQGDPQVSDEAKPD